MSTYFRIKHVLSKVNAWSSIKNSPVTKQIPVGLFGFMKHASVKGSSTGQI